MTDQNPFFKLIWRVNALAIFLFAAFAALSAGSLVAYEVYKLAFRETVRTDRRVALEAQPDAAPNAQSNEVLRLGAFTRAEGRYFKAALVGTEGRGESSYKSGDPIRNVMFLDSADGSVRRLFAHDRGLVASEHTIVRQPERTLLARVFVYVATDTNQDGRVNARDRKRVIVTKPDGSGQVDIATDIDDFESDFTLTESGGIFSYFIRTGGDMRYREFDPATFANKNEVPVKLPKLGE